MGLFKRKKPKERNEIENKELKENIANTAIAQLCSGSDYESLAYTKVEFGYLFDIDNHGIEALFKVITDKNTFYFAVQGQQLLRLDLTDDLFTAYVDGFYATRN